MTLCPSSLSCFLGRIRAVQQAGLTLVELLVVSVLLALMALILYSSIDSILRGRDLILSQQESDRTAQFVLERMTRELLGRAMVPLNTESKDATSGSPLPSTPPLASLLAGSDGKSDNADTDSIRFVTTSSGQTTVGAVGNYGQVELFYFLEPDPDKPEIGPTNLKSYRLIRRESPAQMADKDILNAKTFSAPIAEDIVGFNLRYFREGKWSNDWTNKGTVIPEVVEIGLFIASSGSVRGYKTALMISRPQLRALRQ